MKKTILMLFVAGFLAATTATYAQDNPTQDKRKTESGDTKSKVKPNTTAGDKVHNTIHPKNKRSHGVKAKHKTDEGKSKAETSDSKQ